MDPGISLFIGCSEQYLTHIKQMSPFNTDSYWESLYPPSPLTSRENFMNGISKALKILGITLVSGGAVAAVTSSFYLSAVPLASIGAVSLIVSKLLFVKNNTVDQQAIENKKTSFYNSPFEALEQGLHKEQQTSIIQCFLDNSSFSEIIRNVGDVYVFKNGTGEITKQNLDLIKAKLKELALTGENLTSDSLFSLWRLGALSDKEMNEIFEELLKKYSIEELSKKIPYNSIFFPDYFPNFKQLLIDKLTTNYSAFECKAALSYGLEPRDIANILNTKGFHDFNNFMKLNVAEEIEKAVLASIDRQKLKDQFIEPLKKLKYQQYDPSIVSKYICSFAINNKLDHLVNWGVASEDLINAITSYNTAKTELYALKEKLEKEFLSSKAPRKKDTYQNEMARLENQILASPVSSYEKELKTLEAKKQEILNAYKALGEKNYENLKIHLREIQRTCTLEIKQAEKVGELSQALQTLETTPSLLSDTVGSMLSLILLKVSKEIDTINNTKELDIHKLHAAKEILKIYEREKEMYLNGNREYRTQLDVFNQKQNSLIFLIDKSI